MLECSVTLTIHIMIHMLSNYLTKYYLGRGSTITTKSERFLVEWIVILKLVIYRLIPKSLSRLVHSLFDQEHIIKREKAQGTRLRHWNLSLPTNPPPTVARKNS